ncbi:recombinase family protein, partial [Sphingomonas sp.]|uniref:recombinase family protein n=1 Tax=Sphingomonas sp. TaxID=28214 RepID=UPI00334135FC
CSAMRRNSAAPSTLAESIDRLTRSLADFAKIVEILDKAGASFVSITQSFNTTTSMGRLTLNMLLSFAQFEREVTGERIRDKIAASKRKGLWMGGPVPLGYNVEARKLVVNKTEADLVRHIYQRYLELASVVELAEALNQAGHRTKLQGRTSGPHRGGCLFRRGTLYHLLSNRVHLGQMVHKGEHFAGEHAAIIDEDLWNAVQAKLQANASGTSRRLRSQQPSLLVGLVFDGEGRAMTPSHATKPGKRYRYYITRGDQFDDKPAWRVSAHDLERLVCDRLGELLTDKQSLCDLTRYAPADVVQHLLARADLAATTLRSGPAADRAVLLTGSITRINLKEEAIDLTIDPACLFKALGMDASVEVPTRSLLLTFPAMRIRRGHQIRLVIPGPQVFDSTRASRDEKLVTLIAEAHQARQILLAHPDQSIAAIAAAHRRCRTRLSKLSALACLAPIIVSAIVEGQQPPTLTVRILQAIDLPLDWPAQRALLGFG